jgi:ABC-type Fe3+-siderophore transport system permease subunit
VLLLSVLALLLAAAVLGACAVGTEPFPLGTTVSALLGGAEPWQRAIVLDVRLPRVLIAALGGAGLALSGAALQGLLQNPLADPSVLGVSSGQRRSSSRSARSRSPCASRGRAVPRAPRCCSRASRSRAPARR